MDIIFFAIALVLQIKKKQSEVALIFLTLLSTCWDTVQNSSWPVPHRMSDLGVILGFFVVTQSALKKEKKEMLDRPLRFMFLLTFFSILISVIIAITQSISWGDIYKSTRFFMGAFLAFCVVGLLNSNELRKLLKYILLGNAILCTLIIIQTILGIQILKYEMKDRITEMTTLGIYPPFSLWISIMLLFINRKVPSFIRLAGILQGIFVTLITIIRSYSFVVFTSIAVIMFVQGKRKILSICFYAGVIALAFYYSDQHYDLSSRFFSGNNSSALLRQDFLDIGIKYCNENSPLWGGSLENYSSDSVFSNKEVILNSPDYSTAFLIRFGWLGTVSWGFLILAAPFFLLKNHFRSPYLPLVFLYSYIYIPVEVFFSNILLRPYCLIPLAILYNCTKKDDSYSQDQITEQNDYDMVQTNGIQPDLS